MKKLILVFFLFGIANSSFADFKIDLTHKEMLKELGKFTINDLGVGERGIIGGVYNDCLDDGNWMVWAYTKLKEERSKYSNDYTVERIPKERLKINILPSPKEPKNKTEKIEDILNQIPHIKCKIFRNVFIDIENKFFVVEEINGAKSVKELLKNWEISKLAE